MNDKTIDTIELESKIGERVKEQIASLEKKLKDSLGEIVWQACNDYIEYAEYEPLENWRSRTRDDLVNAQYSVHPESFWGKQQRKAIFDEHKDEILPLIRNEVIEEMEKEIASLKDRLDFEVKLNRSRY